MPTSMSEDKKPKIEAIYPLTVMQQGLLFHHLTSENDQGFLQVQCILEGVLDIEKLKEAWAQTILKHEFLRSSVHWKKIEKPLIIVRPEKAANWNIEDWSNQQNIASEFDNRLQKLKKEAQHQGVTLDTNPLLQFTLIKKEPNVHYFIWKCHHILLDGWSSSIIINDVFKIYNDLCANFFSGITKLPSHKLYLNWKKQIDEKTAEAFWNTTFLDLDTPLLFNTQQNKNSNEGYKKIENKLNLETSTLLKKVAQRHKVTLNTLFQGMWSLTLHRYFNNTDVTFGNTVSGRSGGFNNIESLSGMFANVLPVRASFDTDDTFTSFLSKLQRQQQEARKYEHFSNEKINTWIGRDKHFELFNSLFIFENFPWKPIKSGALEVTSFEGGVTTTYPVNFIVKILDTITYELIVDHKTITEASLLWLDKSFKALTSLLLNHQDITLDYIIDSIPKFEITESNLTSKKQKYFSTSGNPNNYVSPKNEIELALTKIWEALFGLTNISTTDSFFDLGGKSLLAVRMFNKIEEKLNIKLPPTTLLEHKSIQSIANVISNHNNSSVTENSWKYIIPLKASGTKNPLFCIHAGGGHVFFYKDLADAINKEFALYAVQPTGLFGEEKPHQSIEIMSKDYADEIIKIQPEGTINVMVYCFSTGVGVEIASYLKSKGRTVNIIVADTIAEHRLLLDASRLSIRISAFLKRFTSNPFKALNEMIGYRIYFHLKPLWIKLFGSLEEKNTEKMRLHLVQLFNKYSWQTKVDTVSLVLTKKIDARYNNAIIKSWKNILSGSQNITSVEINAKHPTMFEAAEVKETALAIEKCILE